MVCWTLCRCWSDTWAAKADFRPEVDVSALHGFRFHRDHTVTVTARANGHGHGHRSRPRTRASGIGFRDAACGCFGKIPVATGSTLPRSTVNGHGQGQRPRASGIGIRAAACGCCGTARRAFGKIPVTTGSTLPRPTVTANGQRSRKGGRDARETSRRGRLRSM